jgi:hypothetical protein
MGFHVLGRLARRNDLQVSLAHTPGGGITALVALPPDLVTDRQAEPPTPERPAVPAMPPMPAIAAVPSMPSTPGVHLVPAFPADDGRRAAPAVPAAHASPAEPVAAVDAPSAGGHDDLTPEGLVRRVPGAGLSPSLRRRPATVDAGRGAHDGPPPRSAPDDRELMRSMLSRFQASQRAGRAVAEAPAGSLAPAGTHASTPRSVPQEEP